MAKITCTSCGTKHAADQNFCRSCGMPFAHVLRVCDSCSQPTSRDAAHCGQCGTELDVAAPKFLTMSWDLQPSEVGRRLRETHLDRAIQGDVLVQRNARALLFHNGRLVEDLPPGKADLGVDTKAVLLGAEAVVEVEVVLTNTGDLSLLFSNIPAYSGDPLRCEVDLEIVVSLIDAARFVDTLFTNSPVLTIDQLGGLIEPELAEATRDSLQSFKVEGTAEAMMREEVERRVADRLAPSLDRWGFRFQRVRVARIKQGTIDRWLQRDEAELDAKRAGEHRDAVRGREITESRREVLRCAEELDVLEQEWKLLLQRKKGSLETLESLEDLERRQKLDGERKRVIDAATLAELKREIQNRQDDEAFGREATLRILREEQRQALDRLQRAYANEVAGTDQDERHRRERAEAIQTTFLLTEKREDRKKEADLEFDLIERRRLMDHGERERQIALFRSRGTVELDLRERRINIDEDAKDREHRRQIEELQAEADAAARLKQQKAEAKATELREAKNLTAEQLLALGAKDSPEAAAEAIARKFDKDSVEEQKRILEEQQKQLRDASERHEQRMAGVVDKLVDKLPGEGRREEIDRTERMARDAMDKMSDVAGAAAGTAGGSARPGNRFCTQCGHGNTLDAKFCVHCGFKVTE